MSKAFGSIASEGSALDRALPSSGDTVRADGASQIAALDSELEDLLADLPEELTLDAIFDRDEVQRIQDSFALATGVASVITYPDGRPFTRPSNFCRLCEELIRATELGLKNCMKSDAELGRPCADGPRVQRCLSGGLIDGGASIVLGPHHLGNWLVGQVVCEPMDEDRIAAYAREIGVDEHEYRTALGEVTHMPREQFGRIAQALFLIARQLSRTGLKSLVLARQIKVLSRAEQQLRRLALFDTLTSLPNRALADDRLQQAIEQAQRQRSYVGLLFVDLDDFKQVNDSRGHSVGDALLQEAAERLRLCCRSCDTVARLGGDEFLIVLPLLTQPDSAEAVAQKITEAMACAFSLGAHQHFVTASVGIAIYPDDGANAERLRLCADTAMYRAKEAGRNGYRRFSPEMNQRVLRRATLGEGLRDALERHEFALQFQPIECVERSGRGHAGAEVLLRWTHPDLGLSAPAEFVPLAEESGLMISIGAWVLEQACRSAMRWPRRSGAPFVSVNLSASQLADAGFADSVAEVLERSGLPPSQLCLEITESAVAGGSPSQVEALERLRTLGVSIAIDHFGAGKSTLDDLKHLPVDTLKIDPSFVQGLPESSVDRAMVGAICTLGRSLGMRIVAAGVESKPQAECVRACGCGFIQGYLTSQPLSEMALQHYLRQSP